MTDDGDSGPHVLLYIDNSNIFESAKKHSARIKGYRNGIPDVALRIDVGKLIAKALGNRNLLVGKLYGSEPPALDTVWDAIRRKQLQVKTFHRSKWTLKEKEVDTSLAIEAVEDIMLNRERENCTIIIFSGDRDLISLVDVAVKYGYRVEIWSFKSANNNTIVRKANTNASIRIVNIDDIFEEITYTKLIWSNQKIPRERSLLASVSILEKVDKRQFLRTFVEKAGNIFQLPMNGKYLDNYKYIVLVPCLPEMYTPGTGPPRNQNQNSGKDKTTRTYDFYKHIQPLTHILQEHFQECCSEIITWVEFLSKLKLPAEESICSSTRFQLLQLQDSEDDDDFSSRDEPEPDVNEEEEEELAMYSEDIVYADFVGPDDESAPAEFIPLMPKKIKPTHNYSALCVHKFWCTSGLRCVYKHTDEQKKFFGQFTNAKLRKWYKTKPCYHATCKYAVKPFMCPYAHNLAESRCLCCREKGTGIHWMDQCPDNTINKK